LTDIQTASCSGTEQRLPAEHPRPSLSIRIATLVTIFLPLVGLVAGIILIWPFGFGWVSLALLLVMYILTGFGVTVGYHRLFTHRSFETGPVMTAILAVLGSMAVEGPVLNWVATHRKHHQHSDHEDDPHSPHTHGAGLFNFFKGLLHAHLGWMLSSRYTPDIPRYSPDLDSNRLVKFISRTFPVWVLAGLLIPAAIGGLLTMTWSGALLGFVWGGLVRILLLHHVTWSINSVCHIWGTRPFESHDESRNNAILGVLAFGEGWHNNHHAFPTSARHGLRWWEFDSSYLVIRVMEWLGLARRVRVPAKDRVAQKLRKQPAN
jgi:stearoyl-CoA desaturase (delta-9 desaturase)